MFNAVFERFGIDAVMVPVQVAARDLAVFVKASLPGAGTCAAW